MLGITRNMKNWSKYFMGKVLNPINLNKGWRYKSTTLWRFQLAFDTIHFSGSVDIV